MAQETTVDKLNAGHSIPGGLTLMGETARPFSSNHLWQTGCAYYSNTGLSFGMRNTYELF